MNSKRMLIHRYGKIILGSMIFTLGTNLFITPMNLFSSGVYGMAQILRSILLTYLHVKVPANVEIAGIINFALNVPLFVLAFTSVSRNFFLRTVVSLATQTICFTLIPIPATPIMTDVLANCLIGGLVAGYGIGLVLQASATGGGLDILGYYLMTRGSRITIGKLQILVNVVLYTVSAVLFNIETALYSIIYMAIYAFVVDHFHLQNIKIMATVVTNDETLPEKIAHEVRRGVTFWKGVGAYTGDQKTVFVTVISKYELNSLRHAVQKVDPKAFIICNEGAHTHGNFAKHL